MILIDAGDLESVQAIAQRMRIRKADIEVQESKTDDQLIVICDYASDEDGLMDEMRLEGVNFKFQFR